MSVTSDALAPLRRPELVAARNRWFQRLASTTEPVFVQGIWGCADADPYLEPEAWIRRALGSLAPQAESLLDQDAFRPLCVELGPYGVHFVDRIFGAHVYEQAGQWWSEPLGTPIGGLKPPDLDRDPTFAVAGRLAKAFVAANVSVPVFGMPTIASALNVAVNLYGEEFLVALASQPEEAAHDLSVINATLRALHGWYRSRIPEDQLQPVVAPERIQPPGCGQICGCSTHLLSAAMNKNFIAPLDDALLGQYPNGGMIHLCGDHTRHIPVWREMASARAVQLNDRAAEDLQAYRERLRPDQVVYLNPSESMTAERALETTGSCRLVIVGPALRGSDLCRQPCGR